MKIYHINKKILQVNYNRDDFATPMSINVPHSVLEIDEVNPNNKEICIDLSRYATQGKYYVDNLGDIYEVEGWQPQEEYYG
jgi:hypothetical protein